MKPQLRGYVATFHRGGSSADILLLHWQFQATKGILKVQEKNFCFRLFNADTNWSICNDIFVRNPPEGALCRWSLTRRSLKHSQGVDEEEFGFSSVMKWSSL